MPRRNILAAGGVLFCAFLLASPPSAHAGEHVWSAMLFATNADAAKPFPPELTNYKAKLVNVFGYTQFEVLDSHNELMDTPDERWTLPAKHFSLLVGATPAGKSTYNVSLELFHEKKCLVKTNAKLGASSPLFISGPLYGNGQLIFVLLIRQQPARTESIPPAAEHPPQVTGTESHP